MPSHPDSNRTKFLNEELYKKIKLAIDHYFFSVEEQNTKDLSMNSEQTFRYLIDLIEGENPKVEISARFLISLYKGEKTNHKANKAILHAICKSLKIDHDEESSFLKEAILNFKKLCQNDERVKDFAGKYKVFLGGRKQPSIYGDIYENELIIYSNGITRGFNPFSNKVFWGYCLIRDTKTIEIISFDFSEFKIRGIGSFLMFKVNEYKKLSCFFPGIDFSFDSANFPIIYHALLSSDATITKQNKIVKAYFHRVANNLRMECPNLNDTEKLREFFRKRIK